MSHKILIPLYTRKADAVIAVSNTARKHLLDYLGKEENQVFTVYLGVDEVFKKQVTPSQIESTKRSFRLPEHFLSSHSVLSLSFFFLPYG
jgi:cytolysin (calcineurin-like family phosphatase)